MEGSELFLNRLGNAAKIAKSAIHEGILCEIKIGELGFEIIAYYGEGKAMRGLRNIVSFSDAALCEFDMLAFKVAQTIEELNQSSRLHAKLERMVY